MVSEALDYDKDQLDAAVDRIAKQYPDDIEYIRYQREEDWAHVPSLYFRVVLKDRPEDNTQDGVEQRLQASVNLRLRIIKDIDQAAQDCPLFPYVHFRTVSEARKRPDPEWQ